MFRWREFDKRSFADLWTYEWADLFGCFMRRQYCDGPHLCRSRTVLYQHRADGPLSLLFGTPGVSVDKWSVAVRGRSRTYAFADVFGEFENTLIHDVEADLCRRPNTNTSVFQDLTTFGCDKLIPLVSNTLTSLPVPDGPTVLPKYTDVQRIFNKSCIECHGGLDYPPYQNYGSTLDLTENENPPAGLDRLDRSYALVTDPVFINANPQTSYLYQRICPGAGPAVVDPNAPCPVPASVSTDDERCPFGLMPCGGPPT